MRWVGLHPRPGEPARHYMVQDKGEVHLHSSQQVAITLQHRPRPTKIQDFKTTGGRHSKSELGLDSLVHLANRVPSNWVLLIIQAMKTAGASLAEKECLLGRL